MKKLTPSNIFFGIFIILIIIPTTRKSLQVSVQKVLTKVVPATIKSQKKTKTPVILNLDLKGINTPDLTLSKNSKKVTIINYWATWCPPCIAEMPDLQKLYNDYKNDISFVFISNESPNKINSFLEKNNYTLPVYNQRSPSPKALAHSSIPTTFIIDKHNNIVLQKTCVANWNSSDFYTQLNLLIGK